jgi:hypothetical protein
MKFYFVDTDKQKNSKLVGVAWVQNYYRRTPGYLRQFWQDIFAIVAAAPDGAPPQRSNDGSFLLNTVMSSAKPDEAFCA